MACFRASSQKQLIPSPGCRAGLPPRLVQQTMAGPGGVWHTYLHCLGTLCTSMDLPTQAEKGLCYLIIFIHPTVNSSNKLQMWNGFSVRFADRDYLSYIKFQFFSKKGLVADFVFILSTRTSCALISCGFLNYLFIYLFNRNKNYYTC